MKPLNLNAGLSIKNIDAPFNKRAAIIFQPEIRWNCHEVNPLIKVNGYYIPLQKNFIKKVDYLYITVDLDVFNASIAPGVSAPAVKGIDLSIFDPLLEAIKKTGKIKVFDVAECNPRFDLDNRTAKLAAYIIFNYIFD